MKTVTKNLEIIRVKIVKNHFITASFLPLQNSRSTQRTMFTPANLTVPAVFSKLKEIATMTGNSVSTKDELLNCSLP